MSVLHLTLSPSPSLCQPLTVHPSTTSLLTSPHLPTSSVTTRMALSLPNEVWNQILADCSYQSLRNIRRTCTALEVVSTPHVFGAIYVGWLPIYLEKLRKIADSPRLRRHVHTLAIELDLIEWMGESFEAWQRATGRIDHESRHADRYQSFLLPPLHAQETHHQIYKDSVEEQDALFRMNKGPRYGMASNSDWN